MYGKVLLLTVNGTHLDQGLAVTSSAVCPAPTLVNAAPPRSAATTAYSDGVPTPVNVAAYQSPATTAYYQCTVAAVGAGQFVITRTSDGATLATTPFAVPAPQVTMTMSNGAAVHGAITVTLAPDEAPMTVNNFLAYVNAGFYDNTVIHRVSQNFVIQGGGYAAPVDAATTTTKPTSAPIPLEVNAGLSNVQWTVSMARTSAPGSATSQYFINLVDNSRILDASATNPGYAVFGRVTAGTDAVIGIAAAPCTATPISGAGDCTPIPNVVVTSAVQTR